MPTPPPFSTYDLLLATHGSEAALPFFAHVGLAQGSGCSEAFAGAAGGEYDEDQNGKQVREHGEKLGGEEVDARGLQGEVGGECRAEEVGAEEGSPGAPRGEDDEG